MRIQFLFPSLLSCFLFLGACGDAGTTETAASALVQEDKLLESAGDSPEALLRVNPTTITTPQIRALWGSSSNDVWAVGDQGIVLHFNGTSWRRFIVSGVASRLLAIWGTSASNVWAVGEGGTMMRWNGRAWSRYTPMMLSTRVHYNDVYATSANDVWFAGDDGTIGRYDGTTDSVLPSLAGNNLLTIWGSSPSNVFIGGDLGMVLRWDGTTLSDLSTDFLVATTRIRGSSASTLWRTTNNKDVQVWNGSGWADATGGEGRMVYGTNLWVKSSTDVWAFGADAVYRQNGTRWNERHEFAICAVSALYTSGTTDGWASDVCGHLYRFDGTQWYRKL